jgi:hypothetical protein
LKGYTTSADYSNDGRNAGNVALVLHGVLRFLLSAFFGCRI